MTEGNAEEPSAWSCPVSAEGPYAPCSHRESCSWMVREGSGLHLLRVAHRCLLQREAATPRADATISHQTGHPLKI